MYTRFARAFIWFLFGLVFFPGESLLAYNNQQAGWRLYFDEIPSLTNSSILIGVDNFRFIYSDVKQQTRHKCLLAIMSDIVNRNKETDPGLSSFDPVRFSVNDNFDVFDFVVNNQELQDTLFEDYDNRTNKNRLKHLMSFGGNNYVGLCFTVWPTSETDVFDVKLILFYTLRIGSLPAEYELTYGDIPYNSFVIGSKFINVVDQEYTYYVYSYLQGRYKINNIFGTSQLGEYNDFLFVSNSTGFPFDSIDSDFDRDNAGYRIGYSGNITDLDFKADGTVYEFYQQNQRFIMPTNKSASLLNFYQCINQTAPFNNTFPALIADSWRTYDRDEGGEPDTHEFYSHHNRNNPEDDWSGDQNNIVDIGGPTEEFFITQQNNLISNLQNMLGNDGAINIEVDNTDVVNELHRIGGNSEEVPDVTPDNSVEEDDNETNNYDSDEEPAELPPIGDGEGDEGFLAPADKLSGGLGVKGFDNKFKGKFGDYETSSGDLPRIKLPVNFGFDEDLAGVSNDVYLDFNVLRSESMAYQGANIKILFLVLRLLAQACVWAAVVIFVTRDLTNWIEG